MSSTLVVHLELRISPRIFEKIWNGPNGILKGLGETDSWKKNQKSKSRDTVPLNKFQKQMLFTGGVEGFFLRSWFQSESIEWVLEDQAF